MGAPATVYLVEDDERLRKSLTWLLTSHGYGVIPSANITEALASYDSTLYGCIVLDIQLPEGSGLDLLRRFRDQGGTHPFIVMTAYGRVRTAVEAMLLGAVDFLEKPFENDALVDRVKFAIDKDARSRRLGAESSELFNLLRQLNPREWETAELLSQGRSSKEIANALGIKPSTVQVHRRNILSKLNAASSAEVGAIVAKAQALARVGLLNLPK